MGRTLQNDNDSDTLKLIGRAFDAAWRDMGGHCCTAADEDRRTRLASFFSSHGAVSGTKSQSEAPLFRSWRPKASLPAAQICHVFTVTLDYLLPRVLARASFRSRSRSCSMSSRHLTEALFRREAKGGSVMAFSHRRTVRCF